MATQTHILPARARFASLPSAGDRAKAFRTAKRHSAIVRSLRWALPVAALCVTGLYFLPSRVEVKLKNADASIDSVDLSGGALKMVNPRIKGVNEKYGVYDIRADHATQHVSNTNLITLDTITADVTSKTGEKTTLNAPSGIFESKKEELMFDKGVTIGGDAGMSGTLKTATAYLKSHILISKDPVDLAFHKNAIKADAVTFYSSESRAIFEGHVKVHLERSEGKSRP